MDKGTRLVRKLRAVTLAMCAALVLVPLCAGSEDAGRIGITGNAAFHYWRAAGLMVRPSDKEDIATEDFLYTFPLPPELLIKEKPEAAPYLRYDLARGSAMDALHQGASEPECDFGIRPGILPVANKDYSLMRSLSDRACAAALVAEYDKNQVRAAQIYGDLLHLGAHLGQQPALLYGLTGGAIAQLAEDRAMRFLLRNPGSEALHVLLDALEMFPQQPFPFERYVAADAKIIPMMVRQIPFSDKEIDEVVEAWRSDWRHKDLEWPLDFDVKVRLYLRSLPLEQRKAEVERWAKEAETSRNVLAEASRGDFRDCVPKIKEQAERMRQSGEAFVKAPAKGNPFGFPITSSVYVACVANGARINMLRIVCAAELYRSETGAYPERLEQLGKYFPKGLPKDPFTGAEFTYYLEEGLPAVRANPPKEYADEMPKRLRCSLADAGKQQAQSVERYLKQKAEGKKKP